MKIGFIGLGVMGNPMAQNIARRGQHQLCVFDIAPEKASNVVELGAVQVDSVKQASAGADLVITSLPGPKQIEQVAFKDGLISSLSVGAAWVDLSTNNLPVCHKIVEAAKSEDFDFLDAPVSGGDEGARAGNLTVLVGGEQKVFDRYLPVLEIIGENISHLGPNGAGYSAKIAQVVLCYLHSLALSEAMMLGVKGGVGKQEMLSIIQNSTGKSYVADRYGPPILNGDYDPSFTVGLAHKDMKLAMDMADDLGIVLPMCDLTTNTYKRAVDRYGFGANHLKAVRLLEEQNDTFLQI
ncbi:MAG: NAD(P)-dependent oxidoreductase [Gammaproteobacteria bacterium]